jgi:hypothetical protein
MRNYKVHIDLVDLYEYISEFDLLEYRHLFMIVFVEAENPDHACYLVRKRIKYSIMNTKNTLRARIACRKVNLYLRIDRIEAL